MKQEQVWDSIAAKWGEFRDRVRTEVKQFLHKKKGKILDVGGGSGRNFVKQQGLDWYALDFSKEMILLAEKKAKEQDIHLEIKKATVEHIPYEDNFFDYLLCSAVLHCVETKEARIQAIHEMYR